MAQYAVGFDNINRADADRYKIPFTNTADVLTEATAEFAFFMLGMLARKMWPAEHLTRDNQWGYWHPYLPFLGDEVTGKTIAIIGTGRIGLAMIKKCAGFDMNMLCYDPAYRESRLHQGHSGSDGLAPRPRHLKRKELDQVCRLRSGPARGRFRQRSRAPAASRRKRHAHLSSIQRTNPALMKPTAYPGQRLARPGHR